MDAPFKIDPLTSLSISHCEFNENRKKKTMQKSGGKRILSLFAMKSLVAVSMLHIRFIPEPITRTTDYIEVIFLQMNMNLAGQV